MTKIKTLGNVSKVDYERKKQAILELLVTNKDCTYRELAIKWGDVKAASSIRRIERTFLEDFSPEIYKYRLIKKKQHRKGRGLISDNMKYLAHPKRPKTIADAILSIPVPSND